MYSVVMPFEAYKVTRLSSSMKDTEEKPLEKLYMVYVSHILKKLLQKRLTGRESATHSPWGGACVVQP